MSDDWIGCVNALLYGVQFESDLLQGVEHALDSVVRSAALGASPVQYLAAVRAAQASGARLEDLIPIRHSEAEILQFLAEVERRLVGDLS